MIFKNDGTMGYFTVKAMESLLFTSNIATDYKNLCDVIEADNLDFLAYFKELLDNYTDYIDTEMKENVFYITQHFRNKYPDGELRKKAFELTNEIVSIVNRSTEKATNDFIAEQLKQRYSAGRSFIQKGIDNSDIILKYIKENMVDDVYILETHSYLLTEEEFDRVLPLFTDVGNDYIGSVNYMLDEYPALAQEEIFMKRVRKCVKAYEHNLKTYDGSDEYVDVRMARRVVKEFKRRASKRV